jgi:type IV pilus assembly protein PilB
MTAEDPVEFNLPGINQVHTKADIGLTFAAALKAFLRQDPDIIMVGEIRDLETAEIAIKASLTGHMVLSTLHTNSATDTISRLLNMGVEPFNLAAALNCITAQRLLKSICVKCKTEDKDTKPETLIALGMPKEWVGKFKLMKGAGCGTCNDSGMKGRVAVHEVLAVTEPIKESILRGDSSIALKRVAIQNGLKTLRMSAITKMAQGFTTATEVVAKTGGDVLEEDNKHKRVS